MKHWVSRAGGELILTVECQSCQSEGAVESSPVCLKHVLELLRENPDVSRVVLRSKCTREYSGEGLEILKQHAELLRKEKRLPLIQFGDGKCNRCETPRLNKLKQVFHCLAERPAEGAKQLEHFRRELRSKLRRGSKRCVRCRQRFLEEVIQPLLLTLQHNQLTRLLGQGKTMEEILRPLLRPAFVPTRFELDIPSTATLVSSYDVGETKIQIYYNREKLQHLYFVVPPEYSMPWEKIELLARAREKLLEDPPEFDSNLCGARQKVKNRIEEILLELIAGEQCPCSEEELSLLASYLTRFTIGLGIVEVLLADPKIQDIYIDSPCGETPVYINHRDFQECETNIYMSEEELEALISKLRLISKRPFSEAHPVLDAQVDETRITAVGPPLSPGGIALAIRRHKPTPWTLPQMVRSKLLTPFAAGLLSLLVDGKTTVLITGSRGAGKTSLLGALITEIAPRYRIITIEDTSELPVRQLKRAGYKIESLCNRSSVSGSGIELGVEESLRTALRLGDSVLVIGEVRGPEAKILYEAMRIGAAGNTVMGTIHGSSARDVFERVVFDLGVPPTSFKSTDVILTVAPIHLHGGLYWKRRLVQLVEVRKNWKNGTEPSFYKLLDYDVSSDSLKIGGLRKSEVLQRVAQKWGTSTREVLKNLELRAKICSRLVAMSEKHGLPQLLEVDFVVRSNLKWRGYLERSYGRRPSNRRVYAKWTRWLANEVSDLETRKRGTP